MARERGSKRRAPKPARADPAQAMPLTQPYGKTPCDGEHDSGAPQPCAPEDTLARTERGWGQHPTHHHPPIHRVTKEEEGRPAATRSPNKGRGQYRTTRRATKVVSVHPISQKHQTIRHVGLDKAYKCTAGHSSSRRPIRASYNGQRQHAQQSPIDGCHLALCLAGGVLPPTSCTLAQNPPKPKSTQAADQNSPQPHGGWCHHA